MVVDLTRSSWIDVLLSSFTCPVNCLAIFQKSFGSPFASPNVFFQQSASALFKALFYAVSHFLISFPVAWITWLLCLSQLLVFFVYDLSYPCIYPRQRFSFETLYGGQFTLSTQLIIINYPVILSHRRGTTVSLETYPLYAYVNLVICLRKVLIARKMRKTCSRRSQKELQLLECFKNFLGVSYLDKCSADVWTTPPFRVGDRLHILHAFHHTLLKVLTRKICLTIKSFIVGDHFLYSCDLNVWFRGDIVRRN